MGRSPGLFISITFALLFAAAFAASCDQISPAAQPTPAASSAPTGTPHPTSAAPTSAATKPANATSPGNAGTPASSVTPLSSPTGQGTSGSNSADPVVLAAGDIADCGVKGDFETAQLLDGLSGTIITLGDNAYPGGSAADFANCYAPTWGRLKARTRPAPGNHEYVTSGAKGYFGYFGEAAGPAGRGYYSYDIGAWHIVSLDSEIAVGVGSPQEKWLRADLAAHPTQCALAYWHQPRFSSGPHQGNPRFQPLWQALYDNGADLVLNGHDHDYERFALQKPDGSPDPAKGIREFVVGTGGAALYPFITNTPNSEARTNTNWGVLKLTLHPASYEWQFIPVAGSTFSDSGTASCH